MLKTILFDMGNVLVFFSHERMCQQIGAVAGMPADEVRSLVFHSGLLDGFERGRIDEQEFHRRFEQATNRKVDFDALHHAGADIFEPNHSIEAVLIALKGLRFRLVLLSNTCITHYRFVRDRFNPLKYFDDLVLSYEVDAVKPEDAIYRAALAKIQCEPNECFYTDDIPKYVEAGRKHGLQAEVFTGTPDLIHHLTVRGVPLQP